MRAKAFVFDTVTREPLGDELVEQKAAQRASDANRKEGWFRYVVWPSRDYRSTTKAGRANAA